MSPRVLRESSPAIPRISLAHARNLDWIGLGTWGVFTSPMGLLDGPYWPSGPVVLPNLRVVEQVVVVRRQPY